MKLLLVGMLSIAFIACQKGGDGAGVTEQVPKSAITGAWKTYGYKWGDREYRWDEMHHTTNGKESKRIATEFIVTDSEISEIYSDDKAENFYYHSYTYKMIGRSIMTGNSKWGSKEPDLFLQDILPNKLYVKVTYPNSQGDTGLLILSRISESESHLAKASNMNAVMSTWVPKEPMEQQLTASYSGTSAKGVAVKGSLTHKETSAEGSMDSVSCYASDKNTYVNVSYRDRTITDTAKSRSVSITIPGVDFKTLSSQMTTREITGKDEGLAVLIYDSDKTLITNSKEDSTCTANLAFSKTTLEGSLSCEKVNFFDKSYSSSAKKESTKVEVKFKCRLTAS